MLKLLLSIDNVHFLWANKGGNACRGITEQQQGLLVLCFVLDFNIHPFKQYSKPIEK